MSVSSKIHLAILFGGKSAEHEISLLSAKNIFNALDKNKYDISLIGIDRYGKWYLNADAQNLLNTDNLTAFNASNTADAVTLLPYGQGELINFSQPQHTRKIDVVFPILHGPFGEDGTIQGLLKLAQLPFVGSNVLGSAIGMDKEIMKRLLREAQLPIAKFMTLRRDDPLDFSALTHALGLPFFIKPANMGSSVGIHKIKHAAEFLPAVNDAFQYDQKIIIEAMIEGREIECAVLGNRQPKASVLGELMVHHEFYSYQAKYVDPNGATAQIPANLPPEITKKIQQLAIDAFKALQGEDLARVDFFVTKNYEVFINEINTMPGFTSISMYPKLWEASGIPPAQLVDYLIESALTRFKAEQQLKISPEIF